MIVRAFPYDRPCRFQKFEATEAIVTTGTTIWKPGLKIQCFRYLQKFNKTSKRANRKPLGPNVVIDKSEYVQRRATRRILKCDDTSEVRLASKVKPFNINYS